MTHALAVCFGRAAMLVALLFPLQADDTRAPVADPPAVAQPHRGPGIGAAMQPVGPLEAQDQLPIVDPLALSVTEDGAMTVIEPTVPGKKHIWKCRPMVAGFRVVDDGARVLFSPKGSGAWLIVLASVDEAGNVTLLFHDATRGPQPPGPEPEPQPTDPLADRVKALLPLVASSPTKAAEQARLAESFASTAAQIGAGVLTTVEQITAASKASNNVAVPRATWLKFFEGLNAILQAEFKAGNRDYAVIWDQIAQGLR